MLSVPSPRTAALAVALGISCVMVACDQATAPTPSRSPSDPIGERAALAPPYTVYASGLLFPRGLTFGNDGTLYVAEAGAAGGATTVPPCDQVVPPAAPST